MALQRLIDEFSMTHQTAADAVGRSRAAVSNLLRLLDLDQEVKLMLEQRQLDMGHARALLPLEAEDQVDVANRVVKRGLSVRDPEQLVRKLLESVGQEKVGKPEASPRVSEMQERLSSTFGLSVAIRQGRKGGGKVVISYGSEEELDGLLAHIK